MRSLSFAWITLSISFAATLVACGGSQMAPAQQATLPNVRQGAAHDEDGAASMLPQGRAGDLLYISNYSTSAVKVYGWPNLVQTQKLTGFTFQESLCTDANGDIFVANTNADNILEYRHGGKRPVATLADLPKYSPSSCAVDPVSGDLAVTNSVYGSYASQTANLVIFKHAKGTPKPYAISTIYYFYQCGYDAKGNLIANGSNQAGTTVSFAMLPRGSNNLAAVTLDHTFKFPGGIQWDGRHWAIGAWVPDQGANPKTVTEYGPDCGPAETVLTVSGDTLPDNVAFDTNGHVYVANAVANSGGPGNILQYTGTKVTKTLSDPDISTPQGLAVDKRNNVWVSYRDPGSTGTYVAEFRRGKMPAKLFKNISLGFPGSLQFDRKQKLMGPNGNYSSLDIYAPPYSEKKPTTRLILEDGSVTDPSMCTLGPDQGKLYCTFGFFSLVNVFSYPGGKFLYTYNSGLSGLLPYGIANDPAPRT